MTSHGSWLLAQSWFELARYDVLRWLRGFACVPVEGALPAAGARTGAREQDLCEAMRLAECLYVKPVRCLQRSVCTVRQLRRHGVNAQIVVGYRARPFFSHAWVEVDGRVVNDSPAYAQRLRILHRA